MSTFADCTGTSWEIGSQSVSYRRKDNDSSVYIYNQGSNDASVSIYGESSINGKGFGDVSSYYHPDGSKSYHKTISLRIPAGEIGNVYGKTNGVWSPDSVGTYPFAN